MSSGLMPGDWLLNLNGGESGSAFVWTVRSPLPVRLKSSKCMAGAEFETVNRKKLVSAAPGPVVKLNGTLLVRSMMVMGTASSFARME